MDIAPEPSDPEFLIWVMEPHGKNFNTTNFLTLFSRSAFSGWKQSLHITKDIEAKASMKIRSSAAGNLYCPLFLL